MPNDALGIPAVPNGHPNEDDVLLNAETPDDAVEEELEEESDEEEKSDDDEEGKQDDEEKVEEDDEEEPEVKLPFDRPTVKALREAYPDIFKKFPSLRDSYFREIEFTKIFPSVDDAKEAVQENEAFNTISDAALEGDPVPILESLEKTDKKAFTLFAAGFLPALYKRDQETYREIITPVVENLFRQAYRSSDEDTRKAAVTLAKFIFDEHGEEIAQGKKTMSKLQDLAKQQKELQTRRAEETSKALRAAYSDVASQIGQNLTAMAMKQVDPNKTFSPFIRKQLATKAVERIMKQLESDDSHKSVMANRWKKAKQNGYTTEEKGKIVSTFLARAKSLVPSATEKVRTLASGKEGRPTSRGEAPKKEALGGRPSSNHGTPNRKDLRKMTDLEILEM